MKATILNMEDIKRFEHVSSRVSNQYVPIKTSDFVQTLTPTFKLSHGAQYRKGSTAHYVEMTKGEGSDISLYIENSFDRTTALRMSFNYKGFVFGRIKQVHKGKPAKALNMSMQDVESWYRNAVQTIDAMRTINLDKSDMIELAKIVFKSRGVNLNMITNMRYNHANALEYVMYLVDGIKTGSFIRTSPKGPKILKPLTQASLMVTINSKIWNYLSKNNPELYI